LQNALPWHDENADTIPIVLRIKSDYFKKSKIMARLSWFQRIYWQHLAKPAENRALFRYLLDNPIGSVLEIGVGPGERMKQILTLFLLKTDVKQLRYTAVDLFESSEKSHGHLKLKDAHRILAEKSVKAHLIPGDATNALPRVVHTVMPSDLIVIDAGWNEATNEGNAMKQWLPRLSHQDSAIFARSNLKQPLLRIKTPTESMALRAA
jgi:hypothetical protein